MSQRSESPAPPVWLRFKARLLVVFLTLTALNSGLSTGAWAQSATYFDRNNNVSVQGRPHPDYQALGVDAGGFMIQPSFTAAEQYDDNIFAATNNIRGDLLTALTPSVQANSNWSRDAVSFTAGATPVFYANHRSENTTGYNVAASGRLDVLDQSNINGGLGFTHVALPRTSEETFGSTRSPVQYNQFAANLGGQQTLNRVRLTEGFNFSHSSYENNTDFQGAPLLFSQLDSSLYIFSARADYAISPDVAVFASAQGNDRVYDEVPPKTPLDRSSSGYEATVGSSFDLTRLVRGQVQLGYLSQSYISKLFHPVHGPALHASVEYFLSDLTNVTFHADRNVIDVVDPVAISSLQTQVGVQVDHELLRNLILSASGGYETDTFRGVQRTDDRTTASFRATYLMNRHVGVSGGYSIVKLASSGSGRTGDYAAHVISLSLVFRI